ncbi:hypothetical protein LTR08_003193 [Meristemomyces frigidus]|nr:hypothetical protein LTR08_003193 [Meristemomyces frigidus]
MPSAMPPPTKEDKSKLHKLALKGSSKTIVEFFDFACNTILFQRGVYPPEDFTTVKKYGLPMMTTCDDQVKAYIKKIMSQLSRWMQKAKISKLVIVITSKETGEHVERWQFDVSIQSLFRQITASVSFLPLLTTPCTFNVLVYADADSDVPLEWGDSDAKDVKNAEKVVLRSFRTEVHGVGTQVAYRQFPLSSFAGLVLNE